MCVTIPFTWLHTVFFDRILPYLRMQLHHPPALPIFGAISLSLAGFALYTAVCSTWSILYPARVVKRACWTFNFPSAQAVYPPRTRTPTHSQAGVNKIATIQGHLPLCLVVVGIRQSRHRAAYPSRVEVQQQTSYRPATWRSDGTLAACPAPARSASNTGHSCPFTPQAIPGTRIQSEPATRYRPRKRSASPLGINTPDAQSLHRHANRSRCACTPEKCT